MIIKGTSLTSEQLALTEENIEKLSNGIFKIGNKIKWNEGGSEYEYTKEIVKKIRIDRDGAQNTRINFYTNSFKPEWILSKEWNFQIITKDKIKLKDLLNN